MRDLVTNFRPKWEHPICRNHSRFRPNYGVSGCPRSAANYAAFGVNFRPNALMTFSMVPRLGLPSAASDL